MPTLPQRKSPRLKGYDYSQSGAYFVTICTHNRQHIFGTITDQQMHPAAAGEWATSCWVAIPDHYPDVELDAFVIMPNHVHGILVLTGENSRFTTLLGRVVNAYKGAVTARLRDQGLIEGVIWQFRYHDHIIRDEAGLNHIRTYIEHNPALWSEDSLYSTG